MVLAEEEFRDSEYIVPKAFWEQFGAEVHTTSSGIFSKGKFGYEVYHDFLLDEAKESEFDGLFFVGGSGSLAFGENEDAKKITMDFVRAKKPVGAICAAPRLFLEWGILQGKKCTGFDFNGDFPALCEKYGAIYQKSPVITDGKICTGSGPLAAEETAIAFWNLVTA